MNNVYVLNSLDLLLDTYFKSERVCTIASLLQQDVVHGAHVRLVFQRMELDMVEPDVLPEA